MLLYALLLPLLFRPSWKLLGWLTLAAVTLFGLYGYLTGTPAAVILFYGGINLVVFAVSGALLIIIRRAFNRVKQ